MTGKSHTATALQVRKGTADRQQGVFKRSVLMGKLLATAHTHLRDFARWAVYLCLKL